MTREPILHYLDNCIFDPGVFFMDLGHGYFHTANSRLSLFSDGARDWAIVFEKSGYANRSGSIQIELNYFGNGLRNLDPLGIYLCNAKYVDLVPAASLCKAGNPMRIELRDTQIEAEADIRDFDRLGQWLACEAHVEFCRATMSELRMCLPADLPLVMHIDEWHHRRYFFFDSGPQQEVIGERPSSYQTFPMIADVLVHRDPAWWRPTLPPTNHRRNWPDAGSL